MHEATRKCLALIAAALLLAAGAMFAGAVTAQESIVKRPSTAGILFRLASDPIAVSRDFYSVVLLAAYGHFGGQDYLMGQPVDPQEDQRIRAIDPQRRPLCAARDFPEDAMRGYCRIFYLPITGACRNLDGCAELRADPSLLADANTRELILAALQDPCAFVAATPPKNFQWGLGSDAPASGMRCGQSTPIQVSAVEETAPNVIRVRFRIEE